jgi:hypothetical protein
VKHKHPKPIGLRSAERDKARRHGILRLAIVAASAVILAIAALFFLTRQGMPDVPADPNKAASAPAES